ncbi:uncharacterized protein N0V89_004883 [Didymosphaeria variabile]|uniref:Uncharacterized protein n=1 Tax=Didymosphaeria variabile TaxID=1932322 RepID=A0A9W9CDZ7_9PLEO|nr:uncharacterized protein N0V89_004883 [Didymosphaeria variabile]KAJ4356846.1 hypothetical protein N0V89_004883 [Didymosphaeria variabile]
MGNVLLVPKRSLNPGILRVNKQIYAESYEVMVKTNRFVHVCCTGGVHFVYMCVEHRVPMIVFESDADEKREETNSSQEAGGVTQRFRGYALRVTIGNSRQDWRELLPRSVFLEPANIIMLFEDVDKLCRAILRGDHRLDDYRMPLSLDIEVGPVVTRPPFQLQPLTEYFSSTKTQEYLLAPFRARIRGMPQTTISGSVDRMIAEAVEEEASRERYVDSVALLESWAAGQKYGWQRLVAGDTEGALAYWCDVTYQIEEAHRGSSWERLIQKGGPSFVARVAELYFALNLDVTDVGLAWMEKGKFDVLPGTKAAVTSLKSSMEEGFWGMELDWEPSQAQKVKWWSNFAKLMRLEGLGATIPFAVAAINAALSLSPEDAAVLSEKQNIEDWVTNFGL